MSAVDAAYAGSIPDIYDECLGPFMFAPVAKVVARHVADLAPRRILEIAAGTGILTGELSRACPGAAVVATDLNADMLVHAKQRLRGEGVHFATASAQDLPFADGAFDLVVCQFGAMFFPDRPAAFAEARRVLRRGGRFVNVVWDDISKNPASLIVEEAAADMFPDDPPRFLSRVPYGYHDPFLVEADHRLAGFDAVEMARLCLEGPVTDPLQIARGLCQGCPLGAELEARHVGAADKAVALAERALRAEGFRPGYRAPIAAQLWSARA